MMGISSSQGNLMAYRENMPKIIVRAWCVKCFQRGHCRSVCEANEVQKYLVGDPVLLAPNPLPSPQSSFLFKKVVPHLATTRSKQHHTKHVREKRK
jgi:hypothetical protein